MVKCWICGGVFNSREHKFKRSDLVRSSATWAPGDRPYFVGSGGRRRIPSADSRIATFGKVLCGDCNSARTQPFDRAYEVFSEWVNSANHNIMAMPQLDFSCIYGADFETAVLNLQKYFVKHLGCRLASDHYQIPAGLAPSLWTDDVRPLEISFARSRLMGELPARGPGVLCNYPLFGTYSNSSGEVKGPYITGMIVGYLDVITRYAFADRYAWEGDAVDRRNRQVRLGIYEGRVSGGHLFDGHLPGIGSIPRVSDWRCRIQPADTNARAYTVHPVTGSSAARDDSPAKHRVQAENSPCHFIAVLSRDDDTVSGGEPVHP